jgi:hypothetical protein
MLGRPQATPGVTRLIDRHLIWRVRQDLSSARSFLEDHLPRGARWETSAAPAGRGIPPTQDETYAFPTTGPVSVYWLDLAFVALPHGWTGIRADVLVGGGRGIMHGEPQR